MAPRHSFGLHVRQPDPMFMVKRASNCKGGKCSSSNNSKTQSLPIILGVVYVLGTSHSGELLLIIISHTV